MSAERADSPRPAPDRRGPPDRRRRPTGLRDAFRPGGRRRGPRRATERAGPYFVDLYPARVGAVALGLLALCLADGFLTVELLEAGCEEANPLMGWLLDRGVLAFLLGKYALTAIGVPVVVFCKNQPLFGTRFRAGHLLPVFVGLYVALLVYQFGLKRAAARSSPAPGRVALEGTR